MIFGLKSLRSLRKDVRGLAAIEFALIAGFLCYALLNVADVSIFLFDRVQVNNATQMGAQAAWATGSNDPDLLTGMLAIQDERLVNGHAVRPCRR